MKRFFVAVQCRSCLWRSSWLAASGAEQCGKRVCSTPKLAAHARLCLHVQINLSTHYYYAHYVRAQIHTCGLPHEASLMRLRTLAALRETEVCPAGLQAPLRQVFVPGAVDEKHLAPAPLGDSVWRRMHVAAVAAAAAAARNGGMALGLCQGHLHAQPDHSGRSLAIRSSASPDITMFNPVSMSYHAFGAKEMSRWHRSDSRRCHWL